jgi:hypothetical protein
MAATTIDRWHEVVKRRDLRALDALLADEVVFLSPVVHTPQVGRAITGAYLAAAMQVLNNPSFQYLGEWIGPESAVLEFGCTVDGIEVNGVDMIHWDAEGRIDRFKVMVRPLKAIQKIHEQMGQRLQRLAAQQPQAQ